MKSLLRKLLVALALAIMLSPTYPVLASLLRKAAHDAELSAIQAEYFDIAPSVDQLQ